MSNAPSFRSSFHGFNRSDVINFIKALMEENAALNDELAALKNELSDRDSADAARQSESDRLRAELVSCKAEAEAAKAHFSEMEAERQNDLMLGRVMRDARRFSDILVQEANEKANGMLDSAAQNAKDISEALDTIASQTDAFTEYCNDSLAGIRGKLDDLNRSLSGFTQEVTDKKETVSFEEDEEDDNTDSVKTKPRLVVRKIK